MTYAVGDTVWFRDRSQDAIGVVIEVRDQGGDDLLVIEEDQPDGTKLRFQRFAVACAMLERA